LLHSRLMVAIFSNMVTRATVSPTKLLLSAGNCNDARAFATHDNQSKGMTASSTLSKVSP